MRVRLEYGTHPFKTETGGTPALPVNNVVVPSAEPLLSLEPFLEATLADAGVYGGELSFQTVDGQVCLAVTYWLPNEASEQQLRELTEFTTGQLDDGIGEGGFLLSLADNKVRVHPFTGGSPRVTLDKSDTTACPIPLLAIAAREGLNSDFSKLVIRCKDSVNRHHQGHTPLQLAILYNNTAIISQLLEGGADPNIVSIQGYTSLELCAISNSLSDEDSCRVALALIGAGAAREHVAPNGETAKSLAQARGKPLLAELL